MMAYASRTGTRRNLNLLGNAGWGLLVSRAGVWRREHWIDRKTGEERKFSIVGDNGAWSDHKAERDFDSDAFDRFLDWIAEHAPEWIVLPDIVAGGLRSLELSVRWSNRCLSVSPMALIAVQDGMIDADVAPLVGPKIGVFLGGSTPWKISTMAAWGEFCRLHGIYYHVARANTGKRIAMAVAAEADSFDGSSASRYALTLPLLDNARRQQDMFVGALRARAREGE